MEFKDVLKYLREKQNLSMRQLATKVGVDHKLISVWEAGKSKPTLDSLVTLAEFFNVSIDELVGRKEDRLN